MTRSLVTLLLATLLVVPALDSPLADEELLNTACGGCHEAGPEGLSRIAGQRKTPEGWLMTIVRMRLYHGIEMSNAEQAQLVSYLADTQGLAPSETEGWRYALERDPSVVEAVDEPLASMCARCHTGARVALQRRTAEEWLLHMHFHVGQFPTIEYQAGGRDREWFRIATEEIAPLLAETYPMQTAEWDAWQAADKRAPTGDWIVLTELPGKGQAFGRLTVDGDTTPFDVTGELRTVDGTVLPLSGRMNLYTGYEWRANVKVGGEDFRQILALTAEGDRIAGRQFRAQQDSLGGRLTGVRADSSAILGTVPENAPAGTAEVQIVGAGLNAVDVSGATTSLTPNLFGAVARLEGGAGVVEIAAGNSQAAFAFYDTIDRLAVEPAFTIARVGGGSEVGPAKVPAAFTAIGYWNGPDGEPGTADDVRVGAVDAEWHAENRDEIAAAMEDVRFAGTMGKDGIFMPGEAGPNPERPFSTNNAGDLAIKATALGLTGEARLVVTVQRFIDPPIR